MEVIKTKQPQQNIFTFTCDAEGMNSFRIRFNSVFDSGNLLEVKQLHNYSYVIQTAPDCCGTEYESFTRSWFYFGVKGVPKGTRITFIVKRIHILFSLYKAAPDTYKPVYRIGEGKWNRLIENARLFEDPETKSLDVEFGYTFEEGPDEEIFFAFCYPFSYRENQDMLARLAMRYKKDQDIYFHRELLIRSPQDRNIDLITISSHDGKLEIQESFIHESLFPMRDWEPRAFKFRQNKPIVLLTARVHPGETPASHSMNGVIKFLLDKTDVRAQLLRKYFVFMLIPMINPDGVANGHYRMDIYNQNLNRYYKTPDLKKQPAIFAIKELVTYLNSESRLFFYCDLHSHAAKKGCFFFGNHLDFVMQVESMLFAKVMSLNCINFEFESCNFSKKHMFARDRGEKLTKEGAGRVCVYKIANLIHSYTLECGFHYSNELNKIAQPSLPSTQKLSMGLGINESDVTNIESAMYKDSPVYYTIEIYEDVGKAMLVSILDIFEKNPCSRIPNTSYGTLDNIRTELASKTSKITRFRRDTTVSRKCKRINELAKEVFYDDFQRRNCFDKPKAVSKQFSAERKLKGYSDFDDRVFYRTKTRKLNESMTNDSNSENADDDFDSSEERSLPKTNLKNDLAKKRYPTPIPPSRESRSRALSVKVPQGRYTPVLEPTESPVKRKNSIIEKKLPFSQQLTPTIHSIQKQRGDKLAHLKLINRARSRIRTQTTGTLESPIPTHPKSASVKSTPSNNLYTIKSYAINVERKSEKKYRPPLNKLPGLKLNMDQLNSSYFVGKTSLMLSKAKRIESYKSSRKEAESESVKA